MKEKKEKTWGLKALTPIWTGDADRNPDRLIPTGVMGSIRWWFEVLVRGLGGKACDPTVDGVRCPGKHKQPYEPGHHCVVCELFGCTGWARKFRLMILDNNGHVIQKQIRAGQTFILRFIPLRPIRDEEWCLLDATLRLVADYGAMGGKTVFKPSKEWGIADLGADDLDDSSGQVRVRLRVRRRRRGRRGLPLRQDDTILEVDGTSVSRKSELEELLSGKYHGQPVKIKVRRSNGTEEEVEAWAGKRHHQDFGLVIIERRPEGIGCSRAAVEAYVRDAQWRRNFNDDDFAWASLQNFWCVKGQHLTRTGPDNSSFNQVVGRNPSKRCKRCNQVHLPGQRCPQTNRYEERYSDDPPADPIDVDAWLAGRQQESKKIFSFKHPQEGMRTFGFVKPGLVDFEEMKRRLGQVWSDFQPESEFQTGEQILIGRRNAHDLGLLCLASASDM